MAIVTLSTIPTLWISPWKFKRTTQYWLVLFSVYRFSPGYLIPYKWESCYTIQKHSWVYDRTVQTDMFYNTTELLYQLVSTVSCNGNLLLNVGPTADGRILPSFEQRLLEMGEWLEVR